MSGSVQAKPTPVDTFVEMLDLRARAFELEGKVGGYTAGICSSQNVQLTDEGQELLDELCGVLGEAPVVEEYVYEGKDWRTQTIKYKGLNVFVAGIVPRAGEEEHYA